MVGDVLGNIVGGCEIVGASETDGAELCGRAPETTKSLAIDSALLVA